MAPNPQPLTRPGDSSPQPAWAGAGPLNAAAVVSWSGGKDSAMALHQAVKVGLSPSYLLSMMIEGGDRSRSHGLPLTVLQAQADALGSRLVTRSCTWDTYEEQFTDALQDLRGRGAEVAVFGDLDEPNLTFGQSTGTAAGLVPFHPLYGQQRAALTRDLLDSGWEATIIAVRDNVLPAALLGTRLTGSVIDAIGDLGADPLGEGGEYHTVISGGPLLSVPVELTFGDPVLRDGVWFLDTGVARR